MKVKAKFVWDLLQEKGTILLNHILRILQYLISIGVRFDLFFKLLWRHVISVEIFKNNFHLSSQESTERWFFSFLEGKKKKNKEALKYLENWGESFWEETGFRIKKN